MSTNDAIRLKGKPVVEALEAALQPRIDRLLADGVTPKLAIVRMGERPDDIAYERSIVKKCDTLRIAADVHELPADAPESDLIYLLELLARDAAVHGILPFRPLPPHISLKRVKESIKPSKDVDCVGPYSSASIYDRSLAGFLPCTAEAVVALLRHYAVPLEGAHVVVIGRSMVVGRALALLLLDAHCTVTICHSKTRNIREVASEADILISAIGQARMVDGGYVKQGSFVIDVGINDDGCGGICGDVDEASVMRQGVAGVTPVPGGVGGVTTALLVRNVIEACEKSQKN
ncbi:bifunctional 5,10-methylenetetrahydrofolate dehydrogenase/5,10-methenyltetrahydrofolate cyclohydrolase [Synergistaceae bacterium OttesenSCG-928-I11]|nr:bifunctional 5,10-methylenetetrahydrofolate dehydrogenase/5,10-methenyltetrahydrofolate cyclohydrolase [Synergistaceae bacterium OttesenSCG-928-I11]